MTMTMTYKSSRTIFVSVVMVVSLVASTLPALGQSISGNTATSSNASSRQAARMTNLVKRADQEISRRITNLNNLAARIGEMKKLSSSEISNLASSTQGQVSNLTALKAKIDADTDLTTLRTDVQSVTKSYRIYMLVIPQTAIMAAADRVMTIVDAMNIIGGKIQARITSAQSSGKDVTSLQTAFSDLTAKLADADTQAQAAIAEVSGLTPDNGVQTQMQANANALKDARSKIKTAQQDLVAARKDAGTIAKGLRGLGGGPASSTTASTSSNSQ